MDDSSSGRARCRGKEAVGPKMEVGRVGVGRRPNHARAADSIIAFGSALAADAPPVRRQERNAMRKAAMKEV
jgi:hypothetical protein